LSSEGVDGVKYTKESVKIVNQIFKNGVDIVSFPEGNTIQGFALNNCDISKIAVALNNNGHKKINILYNLLIRKRSEDFYRLADNEPSNTEEIYRTSNETDFKSLIENQLFYKYNEMLTIIQDEICKKQTSILFPSTLVIPPDYFNDINSNLYLQDISNNTITNNSFCNLIESHPLLPLYLTTNNRGIISTWSYTNESKKSIDEYYLEKIGKDHLNKIKKLKKLKFNNYGNEFLTVDDAGNLFIFPFEYGKYTKLPKITLWSTNNKSCKDAIFLNNSGIIGTTFNKNNQQNTTLWDFLLPLNQANTGSIDIGGNLILSLASDSTLLVCNDKLGYITFIDIRKLCVVHTFQAHLDEIKAIKVSERENFLVTCGKGKINYLNTYYRWICENLGFVFS
jgi:hypothetical protein